MPYTLHPAVISSPSTQSYSTSNNSQKRTVAKKACLACRDKKIKCDGELMSLLDETSLDSNSNLNSKSTFKNYYKKCTNCKSSNTDCVFVPSKRGGRRKRKLTENNININNNNNNNNLNLTCNDIDYDDRSTNNNSSIVSASVVSNFDNLSSIYNPSTIKPSTLPLPLPLPLPSPFPDQQKQQQLPPIWSTQYNMYIYPDIHSALYQQLTRIPQNDLIDPQINNQVYYLQQRHHHQQQQLPTQQSQQQQSLPPPPPSIPLSSSNPQNPSTNIQPPLPYGNYMYPFSYPSMFYQPPQPPQQLQQLPSINIQQNSQISHQKNNKFIDFEDKNSRHYLKRKPDLSDSGHDNLKKANTLPLPPLTNTNSKESNSTALKTQDDTKDHKLESNEIENNDNNNEEIDNDDTNDNEIDDDDSRSKDSWSVSITPSDSVTMIVEKRKLLEKAQYSSNFTPLKESPLAVYNNCNTINSNSYSNHKSNSDPKNSANSSNSYHNSNTSVTTKFIDTNNPPTSISTDVSITEKWINEQSDELEKSKLEKQSSASSSQRLKHIPTKFDFKLPRFLTEELLSNLKLPDFQTLHKMVGIFYKYVHPNYLILPNMSFIYDYAGTSFDFLAIISCISKHSIKYITNKEVTNEEWLEESYWQNIYVENKSRISVRAMLICLLLQCTIGNDESVNDCINSLNAIDVESFLSMKCFKRVDSLKDSISRSTLLERELFIRCYWTTYKFSIYRRLSFGYPYKQDENEPKLKLSKSIEPPIADKSFYQSTETLEGLEDAYYKDCWISSINLTKPDPSTINDSTSVILSCILLEEVMDCISNNTLLSYTLIRFCHKLKKIFEIHCDSEHLQPYQLKKPPNMDTYIVINSSNFTSLCLNRMTCLFIGTDLSYDLLLYKPKSMIPIRSQLNPFNDSTKIKVDSNELIKITKSYESDDKKLLSWTWFFKSMDVCIDIVSLLKIGEGVCPPKFGLKEPLDELFEIIIGPCCSGNGTAENWCKFNRWTREVSNIPIENQGWIPMPEILRNMIFQVWSFISSLAIALEAVRIVVVEIEENNPNNVSFTKTTKDKYDIGGVYDKEQFSIDKNKRINIVSRIDGEVLVSGIEYNSAPNVFECLIKNGQMGTQSRGIIEKMKIIRRYLDTMGEYHGDCKLGATYCDKVLNYIEKIDI
ncbi:hypothetical protein CANINC_004994 [Pichia inconspicua]|uniref:Zn(2)-C6 fungal-type domain-containing protein n=1 Tax=Pichia inconspicua TaxID=52247 RepID=A0A4V4NF24_9ASCO|nr:hypothetical protein CANINC_004994 [[Candida] inconspicua]